MNLITVALINGFIIFISIMAFSLYINCRLDKMIKMLDEMITKKPK
jgi:hypothetical protein